MNNLEQILNKLPENIRGPVADLPEHVLKGLEEIRIRACGDIRVVSRNQEILVALKKQAGVTGGDLETILNNLLDYSYYAYEEELAKGYITIEGGHRVGVCGRAVLDKGKVTLIKDISSLNIRRGREIPGAGERALPHVLDKETGLQNTLIVSPPKCGKTTLLRDLIRLLSGSGVRIGLCDERSEIAGTFQGRPSYDLGPRTDVLDGCPKAEGMIMLIRAMAPDAVATDEIGKEEDMEAIETAVCAGVKVLTTIHGKSYDDVIASNIGPLVSKGVFSRLIFLTNQPRTGTIGEILHV
ncbi:stage III sporulation protein AA [bacterium 210820-DFI.6.37]|nr:stage III sporulation protein AA [bacterium 210820-DFI.6.37]